MQQAGEHRIEAPREAVWAALNDPEVLRQCIEGCEAMNRVGDDAFQATVKARVGPVSATFTGEVKIENPDPPNGYTLSGSAKGGAAGFGKGTAKVSLTRDGAATVLRYEVEASVGGKLAQVGQRLIDGAARKMADDFFARFSEIVAQPQANMLPQSQSAETPEPQGRRAVWIAAAVGAVVAVLAAVLLMNR